MNKKVTIWNLFSILILAFFALFILYPLFLILYKSVIAGDTGAFRSNISPTSLQSAFIGVPW